MATTSVFLKAFQSYDVYKNVTLFKFAKEEFIIDYVLLFDFYKIIKINFDKYLFET